MPVFSVHHADWENPLVKDDMVLHYNDTMAQRLFMRGSRHRSILFPIVATLQCETLEDAFRLTNHIDKDWWDNPEIKWVLTPKEHRSTSVGDVITELVGNGYHNAYAVSSVGFTSLGSFVS